MNKKEMLEIYSKFPAVLRSKLVGNEFSFPDGTQFVYEKFLAFRGILREPHDQTPLNMNDMRSYYEEGKKPRGIKAPPPACMHSVSLFREYEDIADALHFPKPGKKLAHGYVFAEGGPQCSSQTTSHVDWWLYEGADLSSFKIREDLNG